MKRGRGKCKKTCHSGFSVFKINGASLCAKNGLKSEALLTLESISQLKFKSKATHIRWRRKSALLYGWNTLRVKYSQDEPGYLDWSEIWLKPARHLPPPRLGLSPITGAIASAPWARQGLGDFRMIHFIFGIRRRLKLVQRHANDDFSYEFHDCWAGENLSTRK